MIEYLWGGMVIIAVICAMLTGRMEALSDAILNGAQQAVTVTVAMLGGMGAWTGLLRVAQGAGMTEKIARWVAPAVRRLFPSARKDPELQSSIALSMAANFLGLGNAATPLGLIAVRKFCENGQAKDGTPGKDLALFVVLNTASVQLLPNTVIALRTSLNSAKPFSVVPFIWVTSLGAMLAAVLAAKMMERGSFLRRRSLRG